MTADVTQWTKAAFLNKVGKRTPLFLRFSIVAADEGASDTDRDVRGVAIKLSRLAARACTMGFGSLGSIPAGRNGSPRLPDENSRQE